MESVRTRRFIPIILLLVVVCGAAGAVSWWYIDNRLSSALEKTTTAVSAQESDMFTMLAHLGRNTADPESSVIVQDCSNTQRARFDTLLGRLDSGLSGDELDDLEVLYHQCGDFYAALRAVMADRLKERVRHYSDLREIEQKLRQRDEIAPAVTLWQDIADTQLRISTHFSRLVTIQGEIIEALQNGQGRNSETIRLLLSEAQEIQDSIGVLNIEVTADREELNKL